MSILEEKADRAIERANLAYSRIMAHESACGARWAANQRGIKDIRESVRGLNRLILAVGGTLIVGMAGLALTLAMKLVGI